jgi:PadR family transcriptional regulator PadR
MLGIQPMASTDIDNWKIQIRKGYLELCLLLIIQTEKRIYGFDLLERLNKRGLSVKEGTLYPMLSRMMTEKILSAVWETENLKGHPRKFYSLTKEGARVLDSMKAEFKNMLEIYKELGKES